MNNNKYLNEWGSILDESGLGEDNELSADELIGFWVTLGAVIACAIAFVSFLILG